MDWRWRAAILLTVLCGLLSWGCATTAPKSDAPPAIDCSRDILSVTEAHPPRTMSIPPVDVEISELGSGGSAEEVPQWSEQGRDAVNRSLKTMFEERQGVATVPFNGLSEEEQEILSQHRALYDVIAFSRQWTRNIPAWNHLTHAQYTLGSELAVLRDKIGADSILFLTGRDYHSSAGRKAAFVVYAALTVGGVLPMGYCHLQAGLVDLQTGNLLWTNSYTDGASSLKDEGQVRSLMDTLFANFPYIKEDGTADAKQD